MDFGVLRKIQIIICFKKITIDNKLMGVGNPLPSANSQARYFGISNK